MSRRRRPRVEERREISDTNMADAGTRTRTRTDSKARRRSDNIRGIGEEEERSAVEMAAVTVVVDGRNTNILLS